MEGYVAPPPSVGRSVVRLDCMRARASHSKHAIAHDAAEFGEFGVVVFRTTEEARVVEGHPQSALIRSLVC